MSSHMLRGEVPEWSNGAVSKTVVGASPPRVRIPVSPPYILNLVLKNISLSYMNNIYPYKYPYKLLGSSGTLQNSSSR